MKQPRVLIYDPNQEPENAQNATVICMTARDLIEAARIKGKCRIVWRGFATMNAAEAFEVANRVAWAAGDFTVIWDEVDTMTKGKMLLPDTAYQMIHTGRHRGLKVWACSRRPARVNIDIRSQSARICTSVMHEPADLKALEERMGIIAKEAVTLPAYHFIDWTEAGGKVKKSPFY